MKNIKSYNEVNEGFLDDVKSFFTGDKSADPAKTQPLKQNKELYADFKNNMNELSDLIRNPQDGTIASDDKFRAFFKKPAWPDQKTPQPDKGTNIALQISSFLDYLKKLSPESLEHTFTKGNGEVTSFKNEIKKLLG